MAKSKGKKKAVRNLAEYKKWLVGDSPEAKAWRTSSEHTRQVSEMVSAYASIEGGEAPSIVWSRIKAEKAALNKEVAAKEAQDARTNRLKEVARADYLKNGGEEKTFENEWGSLRKTLLESGRAEKLVSDSIQERRSRSARTF